MHRPFAIAALALATSITPGGAQEPPRPSRHLTLAAGAGLMSRASWATDLAARIDARLDQWVRPRLGLAAEASFLSTVSGGNCDAGCLGPTWAVGVAGHGVVGLGPEQHPDMLSASLGVGVYGVRYVAPGQQPDPGSRVTPGLTSAVQLQLGPDRRVRPVVIVRALLLPDHEGARVRVVSLGLGARW
jgi:hypothetical protein